MGWHKGLKLFEEREKESAEDELQYIHDMEGFQLKHWYEPTKENITKSAEIPHVS